jgi:hypothetical protein
MISKTNMIVTPELFKTAVDSIPYTEGKFVLNEPTGRFFYDKWRIKEEFVGTAWEQLLSMLPVHGEARLIYLKSATCYTTHSDIDDRYHLNLKGEYSYLINIDSKEMFSVTQDRVWYDMNAGPRHSATNFGYDDRVQLVVRQLLRDSVLHDPLQIRLSSNIDDFEMARFIFDDTISPWLNTINKRHLINDFRLKGPDVLFNLESKFLPSLLEILPKEFNCEQVSIQD